MAGGEKQVRVINMRSREALNFRHACEMEGLDPWWWWWWWWLMVVMLVVDGGGGG